VSAQQRAGRAGRTAPGQCFRLYSNESYLGMLPESVPEIQRTNLGSSVLHLKALGVHDVLGFDFFEPPGDGNLAEALLALHALGALTDEGRVTQRGKRMSQLPLEPCLARMLLQALDDGCLEDAIAVASMMSTETVWHRPPPSRGRRPEAREGDSGHYRPQGGRGQVANGEEGDEEAEAAARAHARFRHPRGDHLTLLTVWRAWERAGFSDKWLQGRYLRPRAMRVARLTQAQLTQEMDKLARKGKRPQKGDRPGGSEEAPARSPEAALSRALVAGYFGNAARRCGDGVYKALPRVGALIAGGAGHQNRSLGPAFVYLHPTSGLCEASGAGGAAQHVIYYELVATSRPLMRTVLAVDDPGWLEECRRPIDQPRVTAARLSGQADAPSPEAAEPKGQSEKATAPPPAVKRDQGAIVESARERYLARKKAKK